jgi:hypothetical protein
MILYSAGALLDLVGVDSLDTFILTGLKLGISGCSPPKFFFCPRRRLEPDLFHILLRMDFVVSSFPMSFTTHYSRFRYAYLIALITADVISRRLQCYGFRVLKIFTFSYIVDSYLIPCLIFICYCNKKVSILQK